MVGFTAKLELPRFISKEEILGRHVFDSGLVYMGVADDWTYSEDGQIKMIVKKVSAGKRNSTAFVPFGHIDRVGQFILLKTTGEEFIEEEPEETRVDRQARVEGQRDRRRIYADEVDEEKLTAIIRKLPDT